MNEQDVRDALADLARTPAPPSRVDLARAMATPRRRSRPRAWVPAAASILVVCGLAGATTYAVTNVDRSPPGARSTGQSAAPVTISTPPVITAPRRFDPLIRFASFGWLPEQHTLGWRGTSINAERFDLSVGDYIPDPANGPGAAQPAASVQLTLYAAGVVPRTEQPIETQTPTGKQTVHYGPLTEAPSINGIPAQWVGPLGDTKELVILKWRYAPDAWAELSASKLTGDLRQITHRIASSVRTGGTERLRFPFQLTGLPAGQQPTASALEEGGSLEPWRATLDIGAQSGPSFEVSAFPKNEDNGHPPTTTVDGHPAHRETFDGDHLGVPQYSDRLYIAGFGGLEVNIFIDAATAAQAKAVWPDGVLSIYRTLTVIPDPPTWTDQPVR